MVLKRLHKTNKQKEAMLPLFSFLGVGWGHDCTLQEQKLFLLFLKIWAVTNHEAKSSSSLKDMGLTAIIQKLT